MADWLIFLLHIPQVLCSNLSLDTAYTDWLFCGFPYFLQIWPATTSSFRIFWIMQQYLTFLTRVLDPLDLKQNSKSVLFKICNGLPQFLHENARAVSNFTSWPLPSMFITFIIHKNNHLSFNLM
jgi:hypothetical protein